MISDVARTSRYNYAVLPLPLLLVTHSHYPSALSLPRDSPSSRAGMDATNNFKTINVTPFEGVTFGAEVSAVDWANMSENQFQEILAAYREYSLLKFVGSGATSDALVKFAGKMGKFITVPPSFRGGANAHPVHPEIFRVNKSYERKGDNSLEIHHDTYDRKTPATTSLLHGVKIPAEGGTDTFFYDMRGLYDFLSQEELKDDRVAFQTTFAPDGTLRHGAHTDGSQLSYISRPIVQKDRVGKNCIFLGSDLPAIHCMPGHLNYDRFKLLWNMVKVSKRYAFKWSEGVVVMWDNKRFAHARGPYGNDVDRVLDRLTVIEEPAASV